MSRTYLVVGALSAVALCSCGNDNPFQTEPDGIPELGSPITALATAPTFTVSTGALVVVLADTEWTIIAKHPVSGAIMVNDVSSSGLDSTGKSVLATSS